MGCLISFEPSPSKGILERVLQQLSNYSPSSPSSRSCEWTSPSASRTFPLPLRRYPTDIRSESATHTISKLGSNSASRPNWTNSKRSKSHRKPSSLPLTTTTISPSNHNCERLAPYGKLHRHPQPSLGRNQTRAGAPPGQLPRRGPRASRTRRILPEENPPAEVHPEDPRRPGGRLRGRHRGVRGRG